MFSKKPNLSVLLKRLKNPINYHGQSQHEAMHVLSGWQLQQMLGATYPNQGLGHCLVNLSPGGSNKARIYFLTQMLL